MRDIFDGMAKLSDVFFNGRPAEKEPEPIGVTLEKLAKRGSSVIRLGKKYYRVTLTEVTLQATPKVEKAGAKGA